MIPTLPAVTQTARNARAWTGREYVELSKGQEVQPLYMVADQDGGDDEVCCEVGDREVWVKRDDLEPFS